MTAQTDSLAPMTWAHAFEEGERRIQKKLLDALILTPPRDRARLLTQRDVVKRRIEAAIQRQDGALLKRAWKEQVLLLDRIEKLHEKTSRA